MRRVQAVALLVCLVSCSARSTPVRPRAPAGEDTRQRLPPFTPAAVPLPGLLADVARLRQPTNDGRLTALKTLLAERGLEPAEQPFDNVARARDPRTTGTNLSVAIGTGDRTIVLGAHADAIRMSGGRLSDGMVDNGAGTIVVMRAAETLRALRTLRSRLLVMFFDMEELGLVGSTHFLTTLAPSQREAIKAMVNVDIAGYGDAVLYGPTANAGSGALHAGMRDVCARQTLICVDMPRMPPSDDRSFQAVGVPNVSLATVSQTEASQLAAQLDALADGGPDGVAAAQRLPLARIMAIVHSPQDTIERLDESAMTRMYNVVVGLVLALDQPP